MWSRALTSLARYVDGWRADREESWGHPPDTARDDLVRWLRRSNDRLGARHARRFRQR